MLLTGTTGRGAHPRGKVGGRGPDQRTKIAIRIAVATSEISKDPMQPRRLLKKKNNGYLQWRRTDDDAVPTCASAIRRTVFPT
jgi:hypothetical protein